MSFWPYYLVGVVTFTFGYFVGVGRGRDAREHECVEAAFYGRYWFIKLMEKYAQGLVKERSR